MLRFGAGLVEGAGEWKSRGAKETYLGRRTADLRGAAAVCVAARARVERRLREVVVVEQRQQGARRCTAMWEEQ